MEHKNLDQIRKAVLPDWLKARPLSRAERLERWAVALEREDGRQLNTLFQIEYAPRAKRRIMREDDSLLTVAFRDPHLREEGLQGDQVGDILTFFRISERELHDIACYCHHGPKISASLAAARVRALAQRPPVDRRPLVVGVCFASAILLGMMLM